MSITLYASDIITKEEVTKAVDNIFSKKACSAVDILEKEICSLTGAAASRAADSAESALRALLYSWSVCRGEAVFVPSFANPFTVLTVMESGAVPVFVDCDRDTWNISASKLESAVKKCLKNNELYPRAVIACDMFGLPFDCQEISDVCARYGLLLIEDGSMAFGAEIKGKKTGTLGDSSVVEFRNPMIAGAYAAAALTDDIRLAKNVSIALNGGRRISDNATGASEIIRMGNRTALNEFYAELMLINSLTKNEAAEKRRAAAEKYKEAAKGTAVTYQAEKDDVKGAYPVFALCAQDKESAERMVKEFCEAEIECKALFSKPLCRHSAFKDIGCQTSDVPVGSNLSVCTFMLPCHEKLTEKEINYICEKIKQICV